MSNERTGVLELTLGDTYIGSAYSPQVEVTDTATGHEVAITYMSPEGIVTERFDVADGEQGPQGPAGFSPTVAITDTATGHTVTITDEDGPHSYDVPNYAQEEQERQQAWDELSGDVTDAITAAETATSAASTAATSATGAASSATSAAQAANTAASSANTAASSANAAATAANTAASDASTAATSANAAASAASSAADDASDAADEARQIAEDIQEALDAKADTHGQYPSLSVGRADALTGADETAQWATRVTAGSGAATVRSVQGATVVWNQLADNGNFASGTTRWAARKSTLTVSEGVATVVPNEATSAAGLIASLPMGTAVVGHKYIISAEFNTNESTNLNLSFAGVNPVTVIVPSVNTWHLCRAIWTNATTEIRVLPYLLTTASVTTSARLKYRNVQVFDLTQMFGAGNEPSTVAEFEAMYPEPYYPYSAPTLKPVQIAGIRSTDAQGGELDSVEWPTQTLRAAGSVADMLYSDHVDVNVGSAVIDGNTQLFISNSSGTYVRFGIGTIPNAIGKIEADTATWAPSLQTLDEMPNGICSVAVPNRVYFTLTENETTVELAKQYLAAHPITIFYPLATPTTTPISPALPMTYRVEQGGTETIIVPTGEVSATPVLTVAECESAADVVMDALACIATPDGPVATSSHAIDTYLTMQGKLYRVTSAIAVGETIAAGTNVTATTVMAELIARTA